MTHPLAKPSLAALLCLSGLLCACAPPRQIVLAPEPEAMGGAALVPSWSAQAQEAVRGLWSKLGSTQNTCNEIYDYHPQGGLRNVACHLGSVLPYARLIELAQLPAFVSGPHTERALALQAPQDFGRYNPEFVRWLVEGAVPAASDPAFQAATAPLYFQYIQPLAIVFTDAWNLLQRDPACFEAERSRFERLLAQRALPEWDYTRFYYFMDAKFCAELAGKPSEEIFARGDLIPGYHDGNVVQGAVAFWIRRSVDGTAELFYEGLTKLRLAYEEPLILHR